MRLIVQSNKSINYGNNPNNYKIKILRLNNGSNMKFFYHVKFRTKINKLN